MVKNHLLLFTIGPVQPFIAQARKTRDLWLGSFLLSKLMEAAMKDVSGELSFPANRAISDTIADLPNKFVALFDTSEQAWQTATAARDALAAFWEGNQHQKGIADRVWQIFSQVPSARTLVDAETDQIWERQTRFASFFEVYWVVVARRDTESYGDWYKRAQQGLDARKRLRAFLRQDETGEKSTISGEREALRSRPAPGETLLAATQRFWSTLAAPLSDAQITQGGRERLDAIDTIKRFAAPILGFRGQSFPSTSTVAAAPFIAALLQTTPKGSGELATWEQETSRLVLADATALPYLHQRANDHEAVLLRDGDSFFLETFTPKRLKEDYNLSEAQATEVAQNGLEALKKLRQAAGNAEIDPPSPYFAVLTMDGDHMGTLLSHVQDEQEHSRLSKALSTFSRSSEQLVQIVEQKEYAGKLVYAGGDDVLALAPMRHALPLSDAVQAAYQRVIRPHKPANYPEGKVTMSAGVAIAHYLNPLSQVLRAARQAEELAKEAYGRNALVVTLLRRSGEPTTVGCKWRYDIFDESEQPDEQGQPLVVFQDVADLLECGVISTNFIYTLAGEAATLSQLELDAQKSEIGRLLRRGSDEQQFDEKRFKQLDEKRRQALREQWEKLPGRLVRLATAMSLDWSKLKDGDVPRGADRRQFEYRQVELWQPGPRRGLVEVSGWLLLMSFTLRGRAD